MANYKKVFFYPWVGPDYKEEQGQPKKGINFDPTGRLIFKEEDGWKTYEDGEKTPVALSDPNLKPLQTAVYGKEHYCKDRVHCAHRILEQNFYLQMLTPATLSQLQNAANVAGYINQLAQFHTDPLFTLSGIDWKDKFYVLHKDYNWPLAQIQKRFKLSFADLCLYMALEKILTIHSLWDKSSKEQANEVVQIVQNFQQFKDEAELHHFCRMHTEFTCPVCHKEKFTCKYCEQLPICRYQTQRQLSGYSTEIEKESDSHRPFREALGNTPKIWKHLLFSNFYQRSMPDVDTDKNAGLYKTEDYDNAKAAFLEVVKENKPNIIVTWGKEDKLPILELPGVRQMPKTKDKDHQYQIPRIHIAYDKEKDKHKTKYTSPFTILDYEGEKILILFLNHPSRAFGRAENNNLIRCAFNHYDQLKEWDPVKNQNTLGLSYPITCEFDTDLKWLKENEKDFEKCT